MRNPIFLGSIVNKAQEVFSQAARTVDNFVTQPRVQKLTQNADNLNISNNLDVAGSIGEVGNGAIQVPLTPAQKGAQTRARNKLAKQQEAERLAEIEREANRPRDRFEEAYEQQAARSNTAGDVAGTPKSEKPPNLVDHIVGDTKKAGKGIVGSMTSPDAKSSKLWRQSEENSKNAKELRAASKGEGLTADQKATLNSAADREWLDGVENKFKAGGSWITGDGSFPLGAVRIAGAYAAVDVTGRALGGGTLTTDSNGKQNIAGVPFI